MQNALFLHFLYFTFLSSLGFAEGFGNGDYVTSIAGNTVLKAIAQRTTTDTNFIAVGRTWAGSQYKALIASYLSADGLVDTGFVGNNLVGKKLYDFAGVGGDNLCSAVIYAYDGFIAACRSMKANGYYEIYLIKFDNGGIVGTTFGTSGIATTGLGGSVANGHALVRGIIYDPNTGNGGNHGTVIIAGETGEFTGVMHPFVAAFDQSTGAQYGSTTTLAGINGTAVGIAFDSGGSKYYTASTETSANHSFYVHQFNTSLVAAGAPWGAAVDFTAAIAGGAADSIPSAIAVVGSDVITVGGNRVNTSSPWRCAIVAHVMASGNLDASFGTVPAPLAGGTANTGISLFTVDTAKDCIANATAAPPAGSNILVAGTIYNGSNYDFMSASLNSSGTLNAGYGTSGIKTQVAATANDVISSIAYLGGSNTYTYGVGRSEHSSLYNGGMTTRFATADGAYVSNTVLNLDASKATSWLGPASNGCSYTHWLDLSTSAKVCTLTNFAGCGATSGWNGSGTGADPYRLTLDGSNDYLDCGSVSQLQFAYTDPFSVATWLNVSTTIGNSYPDFVSYALYSGNFRGFYGGFNTLGDIVSNGFFFDYFNGAANTRIKTNANAVTKGKWYHVIFSKDNTGLGTGHHLYLNGVANENTSGSVASSIDYTTLNYRIGARETSENFKGEVGKQTYWNTQLSAAQSKKVFDAEAEGYRATAVGPIVTNGLVLNYDAANAAQGMNPFSNGCAAADLSWFDLSTTLFNGALTNFAGCGSTTGWNGDGTTTISGAAGPYRLTFDGSNDCVQVAYSTALNFGAGDFSVEAWFISSNTSDYETIFNKDTGGTGNGIIIYTAMTSGVMRTWVGGTVLNGSINIVNGAWRHIILVRRSGTIYQYVDGALDVNVAAAGGTNTASSTVDMGYGAGCTYKPLTGSIAVERVYNRALSLAEVKQNCNAIKSRFNGMVCN